MTGTPAKRMRWKLDTTKPKSGVTVRIYYPSAESRSVKYVYGHGEYGAGEIIPYT